ncbi:MAG: iron-sulfur cluster repair di-iron protein [Acidobacteriota bacterium]|jgi:regulator of cell morphogenesis and NO signaling
MNITAESRVGEIAAHHPMATRVFARHGIDFCCGGGVPLEQACARRDLDTVQVLDEIDQALAEGDPDLEQWTEAPAADLVRHIVHAYHMPLREELPRLESMLRKVNRVHGDKDPERLGSLLSTFLKLQTELADHMAREEGVLFPEILEYGEGAVVPFEPFVDDHTEAGEALARIRELTDDYRVPDGACNTWRALWHGLEALEESMHQHIHLENNVLFPRVNGA